MGGLIGLVLEHQRLLEHERRLAVSEALTRQLTEKLERLRTELSGKHGFDRIIGTSPALVEVIEKAKRVAPMDTTVLIDGESGTGKELMARAIHYHSRRAEGPLVTINCAAIPETLLESELFGYERGAFSGADKRKPGRIELAQGGSLFLDEVAEMPLVLQAKLLRFLQQHEFQRLGGTETLTADVRLIAATNKELATMVDQKTFREDLYYRLNVVNLVIPPLRARQRDVLLLTEAILKELAEKMGKKIPGLSQEATQALLNHPWRGNIRELLNALEHAVIFSDGDLIRPEHLPFARAFAAAGIAHRFDVALPETGLRLDTVESQLIQQALERTHNNLTRAAELLGIPRTSLRSKLNKHRIHIDDGIRR